jgi:hypothetical protein
MILCSTLATFCVEKQPELSNVAVPYQNELHLLYLRGGRDLTSFLLLLICVTLGLTGCLNLILDKSLHSKINKPVPETSPWNADNRIYSRKEQK